MTVVVIIMDSLACGIALFGLFNFSCKGLGEDTM